MRKIDMIGKRYGMLIVLKEDIPKKTQKVKWICKCDCGNLTSVDGFKLRSGETKSCSCYKSIASVKYNKNRPKSLETRKKISRKLKGRKLPESTIEKMRKRMSGKGNPQYGLREELSPNWIKDRKTLKKYRGNIDTKKYKNFIKKILKERNYICELTNIKGGQLEVHHVKPIHKYPNLIVNFNNVIIIQKKIHRYFHKLYTTHSNEIDWYNFLENKEYLNI